jgi:hypothetical protein
MAGAAGKGEGKIIVIGGGYYDMREEIYPKEKAKLIQKIKDRANLPSKIFTTGT